MCISAYIVLVYIIYINNINIYNVIASNVVAGRYDTTQLVLKWEVESPVTVVLNDNFWVPYLTEYKLLKIIPQSSEHYVEPISLDPTSSQYIYRNSVLYYIIRTLQTKNTVKKICMFVIRLRITVL